MKKLRWLVLVAFLALLAGCDTLISLFNPPYSNKDDTTTESVNVVAAQLSVTGDNVTGYIAFTDQDKKPITGLNQFNFSVEESLDNKKWQLIKSGSITVKTVESAKQPISAAMTMDYSGSMSGTDVTNMTTAIKTFVGSMGTRDQAQIIKFNSNLYQYPADGFSSNKDTLIGHIDLSEPTVDSGYTALYDAMGLGMTNLNLLPEGSVKALIAFTDGADTNSADWTKAEVLAYSKDHSIPIYTIGFGGADQYTLEQLATSGIYLYNPDSQQLSSLYDQIIDYIKETYIVSWDTIGSSGDTVYVKVTVTYTAANETFEESTITSYTVD